MEIGTKIEMDNGDLGIQQGIIIEDDGWEVLLLGMYQKKTMKNLVITLINLVLGYYLMIGNSNTLMMMVH